MHARTHTHSHNKCLFCCLQQNASGVYSEDGQGPSSTRGYGESHQAVKEGMPVRKAAKTYSIARTTLNNNLVKAKKDSTAKLEPNYKHSQIFDQEQETSLANYLEKCSGMFHGLTTKNVRTLAYEMAFLNRIEMPATWTEKQIAGREWLFGFLRRHETLAIRQPEATSIARATAFNRATVGAFFDILHDCLEKIGASGDRIFNLDETGVTTVQKVPKVVATKGLKQVGQITSRKRGEFVTVCVIVSASGQTLPPAFAFPRKNFKEFMMHGSPEGSLGLVDSSGWMTAANFIKVMNHVITNARPSQDRQVVLIMDNHQSHLSYEALSLAKENFVHIITLPPHTSNKTQPLDRTVFGHMKTLYNQLANSWMMRNVGKLISIYQIAELAALHWQRQQRQIMSLLASECLVCGHLTETSSAMLTTYHQILQTDLHPMTTMRTTSLQQLARPVPWLPLEKTTMRLTSLQRLPSPVHCQSHEKTTTRLTSLQQLARPARCQSLEKTTMRLTLLQRLPSPVHCQSHEKTTMRLTSLQQFPSPVHCHPLRDRLILR